MLQVIAKMSVTVCDACRSQSVMSVGHGLWCLSVTVYDGCRSRFLIPVGHGLWCWSITICDACRSRSMGGEGGGGGERVQISTLKLQHSLLDRVSQNRWEDAAQPCPIWLRHYLFGTVPLLFVFFSQWTLCHQIKWFMKILNPSRIHIIQIILNG